MTHETRIFFFKSFMFLLLLGLPPLCVWSSKTIANIKGWQWFLLPLIIYINVFYIVSTSVGVNVMLADVYRWDKVDAENVSLLILLVSVACFTIGSTFRIMTEKV